MQIAVSCNFQVSEEFEEFPREIRDEVQKNEIIRLNKNGPQTFVCDNDDDVNFSLSFGEFLQGKNVSIEKT